MTVEIGQIVKWNDHDRVKVLGFESRIDGKAGE
jgi:hypothetical protein